MESHLTGSTSSNMKWEPFHSLLFHRRKSILQYFFLPAEDHISMLCSEHNVAKYSGMQMPNQCSSQGSFQANSFQRPALPSVSFGCERRTEGCGAWERLGGVSPQTCAGGATFIFLVIKQVFDFLRNVEGNFPGRQASGLDFTFQRRGCGFHPQSGR